MGNVSLNDTQRACKVEQEDETAKLTGLRGALIKKDTGEKTKVNVADFETVDILDILNDLKFIDVSTTTGVSDAAAANHSYTHMFDCKMFIQDSLKDVQVFGRKNT